MASAEAPDAGYSGRWPSSTITGAAVLRADGWVDSDLVCRDGLVVDGPPTGGRDSRPIDGTGLLVAPGFVDLQCNGGLGIDLTSEPGGLWELGAALPAVRA